MNGVSYILNINYSSTVLPHTILYVSINLLFLQLPQNDRLSLENSYDF
jgi:hypothetical protein